MFKAKDGQDNRDGDPEPFKLETVSLGYDSDGEPVSSCVVVRGEPEQGQSQPKLTPTEKLALSCLRKMEQTQGEKPPDGAPDWVHVAVSEEVWRAECYAAGISTGDDPSAKRKAFQRARQGLMDKRMVGCRDDLYWIA